MDEGDVLTTLKILIIGESGVGKSRYIYTALSYMDWYRQRKLRYDSFLWGQVKLPTQHPPC